MGLTFYETISFLLFYDIWGSKQREIDDGRPHIYCVVFAKHTIFTKIVHISEP